MKRTVSAALILLACAYLLAEDGADWPRLSQEQWASMTPDRLSQLLETHDVNARDQAISGSSIGSWFGMTALMHAARFTDSPEVIGALVQAGARIDIRAANGQTALMHATRWHLSNPETSDNFEVIQALIAAGANVNAAADGSRNALLLAAGSHRNPEVVRALIAAGADVEARSGSRWATTLMVAAGRSREDGGIEVVLALIAEGADVNAKDARGKTVLMHAARWNPNPQVMRELLDAGADPFAIRDDGETAWRLMRHNRSLWGSDVYWELNELRFQ